MLQQSATLAHTAPGTLAHASQLPRITLHHPDDLPRLYALICDGHCMEPLYGNGQALLFSKAERWQPGDIVAVYRRHAATPQGENPVLLKRLVSAPPPSFFKQEVRRNGKYGRLTGTFQSKVILRMLNPDRSLMLKAEDVEAIHKCLGHFGG